MLAFNLKVAHRGSLMKFYQIVPQQTITHGTYVRWQLRTRCGRVKEKTFLLIRLVTAVDHIKFIEHIK